MTEHIHGLPTHANSIGRLIREKVIYECSCHTKFVPKFDRETRLFFFESEDGEIRVEST